MAFTAYVVIGLMLATIIGALGQNIAYDLNERFPVIDLTTAISSLTFISVGLFVLIPITLFIYVKNKKAVLIVSVSACILIGLPVSIWSLFVWLMWIG